MNKTFLSCAILFFISIVCGKSPSEILFPELVLEHFAGRVSRELIDKDHTFWNLVFGQPSLEEIENLRFAQRRPSLQDHNGPDHNGPAHLAPNFVLLLSIW